MSDHILESFNNSPLIRHVASNGDYSTDLFKSNSSNYEIPYYVSHVNLETKDKTRFTESVDFPLVTYGRRCYKFDMKTIDFQIPTYGILDQLVLQVDVDRGDHIFLGEHEISVASRTFEWVDLLVDNLFVERRYADELCYNAASYGNSAARAAVQGITLGSGRNRFEIQHPVGDTTHGCHSRYQYFVPIPFSFMNDTSNRINSHHFKRITVRIQPHMAGLMASQVLTDEQIALQYVQYSMRASFRKYPFSVERLIRENTLARQYIGTTTYNTTAETVESVTFPYQRPLAGTYTADHKATFSLNNVRGVIKYLTFQVAFGTQNGSSSDPYRYAMYNKDSADGIDIVRIVVYTVDEVIYDGSAQHLHCFDHKKKHPYDFSGSTASMSNFLDYSDDEGNDYALDRIYARVDFSTSLDCHRFSGGLPTNTLGEIMVDLYIGTDNNLNDQISEIETFELVPGQTHCYSTCYYIGEISEDGNVRRIFDV